MRVRLGNIIYHHRNVIFPVVYVLLFIKGPVIAADYLTMAVAGFLIAAAGQLVRGVTVGLEYIKRGGKNRMPYADDLVQGGIFAHCRNPLYVGNFTILLGTGIASNSLLFMAVGMPFFLGAYTCMIAAEENYLRGRFGAEFDDYCRRVNRIVPRIRGLNATISSMSFNWKRLVSAEYNSAFIWIIASLASILQNVVASGDGTTGNPLVIILWTAIGLTVAAYLVARIFKKSGRLRAPGFEAAAGR